MLEHMLLTIDPMTRRADMSRRVIPARSSSRISISADMVTGTYRWPYPLVRPRWADLSVGSWWYPGSSSFNSHKNICESPWAHTWGVGHLLFDTKKVTCLHNDISYQLFHFFHENFYFFRLYVNLYVIIWKYYNFNIWT